MQRPGPIFLKKNLPLKCCHSFFVGEKLTKEETKALMKELCDPADDDGFMPFKRKSSKALTPVLFKKYMYLCIMYMCM
jgi:hypothetical protein